MNKNEIKKILEELYAIDGSLRAHEHDLITLIESLAPKYPVERDQQFFSQLRAQVLLELSRRQEKKITISTIFMKNIRYMTAGFAVLVIAGLVGFQFLIPKQNSNFLLSVNITKVGDNAFGPLASLDLQSQQNTNTNAASDKRAAAFVAPSAAAVSGGTATQSTMMAAVEPNLIARPFMPQETITYVYKGATFTQDQAQVDVLKQMPGGLSAGDITAALGSSGSGLIGMSSFSGSQVTNVTFAQNQSFGYITSIDFAAGDVSISMNGSEWPQNNDPQPLTASDIPATSTVIGIADQFLADHHIPTANYGSGKIINNSYAAVPVASNVSNGPMIPYYSDSMQVLYPLLVNGKEVYQSGGSKVGLSVEVNIRYKKVANVYGLDTQNYQASSYAAITDVSKLISLAEEGQSSQVIYYGGTISGVAKEPTSSNAQKIDLGTPVNAYVQLYQYDNATGVNNQFLVPALVFPVITKTSNVSNAVVVPLVQDFLQDNAPVHILNEEAVPPPVPAAVPKTATP